MADRWVNPLGWRPMPWSERAVVGFVLAAVMAVAIAVLVAGARHDGRCDNACWARSVGPVAGEYRVGGGCDCPAPESVGE